MDENYTVERDGDYYNCCHCGEYAPEGEALVFYAGYDDSRINEAVFRLCRNCVVELDCWVFGYDANEDD